MDGQGCPETLGGLGSAHIPFPQHLHILIRGGGTQAVISLSLLAATKPIMAHLDPPPPTLSRCSWGRAVHMKRLARYKGAVYICLATISHFQDTQGILSRGLEVHFPQFQGIKAP